MMQVLLLSQLLSCTLSNGSRRLPTRQLVSIVVSGGVLGGADRWDHVESAGLKDGLVRFHDAWQASSSFTFNGVDVGDTFADSLF